MVISVAFIALRGLPTKESSCNAGNPGSILGSGRFPRRREWLPTPVLLPKFHGQRSLVGCVVHEVIKHQTQLRDGQFPFFFFFHFYFLESLESWQLGSWGELDLKVELGGYGEEVKIGNQQWLYGS